MSKKKVSPRAPFVVTVAMAGSSLLALLPACGTQTDIITNPPPPAECPAAAPTVGAACTDESNCSYGGLCAPVYSCSKGAWVENTPQGTCNPPAPVCPEGVPTGGSACTSEGQVCDYQIDVGCGPQPAQLTCTSGAWVENQVVTCNPPAPEPCTQYGDETTCKADVMCNWLVPGCGMPALPFAGCHAKTPCATDTDCIPTDTCQSLVINPCWMQACDACGATVLVCMPPPPV